MPKVFPWNTVNLTRTFQKNKQDANLLKVFRKGVQAYLKKDTVTSISEIKELWDDYIEKLPEVLKNQAYNLTSYVIYAPPRRANRTLVDILKALLLISMPDRQLSAMGIDVRRGREDIKMGEIEFRPDFTNNTVMLSVNNEDTSKREAFEDFIRDNELRSETSKFQFIFQIIKPETVYDKYTTAKCALEFINTFREDFLNILNDPEVTIALKVGEISHAQIIKALSDRYAYYLAAYVLKKTAGGDHELKFSQLIARTLTNLSGHGHGDLQFNNIVASKNVHSDMSLLVEEYVNYYKAGIVLQVAPAITLSGKARQNTVYNLHVKLRDAQNEEERKAIYEDGLFDSDLNDADYLSKPHELILGHLVETMPNEKIWEHLCESNQSYFKAYDQDKTGGELHQLAALALWEAFVSHENCPSWIAPRAQTVRKIIIAQTAYQSVNSVLNDLKDVLLIPDDKALLIEFSRFNQEYLKDLEEDIAEPHFYKNTVQRLWDNFVKQRKPILTSAVISTSRIKNKSETTADPFLSIIFDSHLKEVMVNDYLTCASRNFANALEAVAIVWRYPAILNDASLKGSEQDWNSFPKKFKSAIKWMRAHPDYVYSIHQIYDSATETSAWKLTDKNEDKKNRQAMLRKIIPEFLRVVDDSKMLRGFFESNGAKKIEMLAISAEVIQPIKWLQDRIQNNQRMHDNHLEKILLQHVKIILLAIVDDFREVFPESAVFNKCIDRHLRVEQAISSMILYSMIGLNNLFDETKTSNKTLDYYIITTLTKDVFSRFFEGYSEGRHKKISDIYVGLSSYIEEAFPKDCSYVNYKKFFPNLEIGFTSFTHIIFSKWIRALLDDHADFTEILRFQASIPPKIFLLVIRDCLLEAAKKEHQTELDFFIDKMTARERDLFLKIIKSALTFCSEHENISFLIASTLKMPEVVDILSVLLTEAACQNQNKILLSLTSALPKKMEADSSAKLLSSIGRGKISLRNQLSVYEITTVVPTCESIYEAYLVDVLNQIEARMRKPMLNIFNSALTIIDRFRLIGDIAKGKNNRLTLFANLKLKKIYVALAHLCDIRTQQDIEKKFLDFENEIKMSGSDIISPCAPTELIEKITEEERMFANKLESFDGLFEIFNGCFMMCLNAENPFKYFHEAINVQMKKMDENNLNIETALMLRHFYLMFFPKNFWVNERNQGESDIFFVPLEDDLLELESLKALQEHILNFSPAYQQSYIDGIEQCLKAAELSTLRDQVKSVISICAWLAALRYFSLYADNEISFIYTQIETILNENDDLFKDMRSIWLKYKTVMESEVHEDNLILNRLKLLIEIQSSASGSGLSYFLKRFRIESNGLEEKTKEKEKLEVCQFVFSSTKTAIFASKDFACIEFGRDYQLVDSFFEHLLAGFERVQELVKNPEYEALLPYLMEYLFVAFNVIYRNLTMMPVSISEQMQTAWNNCILKISAIADATPQVSYANQYRSFAKTWKDIGGRIFSKNTNLYDLVLAYETCLMLEETGFSMVNATKIICDQWKMITGYNLHAEVVKALCFIFDALKAGFSHNSDEVLENFNTFLKSAVKKIQRSNDVLNITVSDDCFGATVLMFLRKKEISLEKITLDLEKSYTATARLRDEQRLLNFPVVFCDEKVKRCVEVYWNNHIIERKECLRSESYLMARYQKRLPAFEFFDLVLQLLQESMQIIVATHMSSIPISFALLESPSDIYDDPRVLHKCRNDELIGLFVLGLIYQEIARQIEHEKNTKSRSSIAVHWVCNLPRFFADYSSQKSKENIRALAKDGIVQSKVLNYGLLDQESDPINKNLHELDRILVPQLKNNQANYVAWYTKNYLPWFKGEQPQETSVLDQSMLSVLSET